MSKPKRETKKSDSLESYKGNMKQGVIFISKESMNRQLQSEIKQFNIR
jgi:hypothetical protein